MSIIATATRNRSTVFLILAFIMIGGWWAYRSMPREASPDITIPYVIVTTPYFGVSPSDIETLVTVPIENKLKNLAKVKEMRSTSAEGVSLITIEFVADADIDDSLQKVRDKVSLAKTELPPDAEEPIIQEINLSEFPIMIVNVSGDVGLIRLKDIADGLKDEIEGVPGVLNVEVTGGLEREIRIEYLPERLAAYHLSYDDVVRAVSAANVNLPAGNMILGEADYLLRIPGEFDSPAEIADIIIATVDRRPVYVRDVANVVDGYKEAKTFSRLDGKETVSISIQKRSGENAIAVCDGVRGILQRYEAVKPKGVALTIASDMSKDIRKQVADLNNNIITGFLLVILVILFFMGVMNSLFVAAAIPLSMFMSFIVLHLAGITLNMVVLFSLVLTVGMLVDNAVVIVENIYRHLQMGKSRARASVDGAREVIVAVLTSTLTTVAAFVPFLFWPGIFGKFMWYLPVTVITGLLASFLIALAGNPALTASFMRLRRGATIAHIDEETGLTSDPRSILNKYEKVLRWCLERKYLTIGASFGLLAVILVVYAGVGKGVEFFPDTDPVRASINVRGAEGTNLASTDRLVRQIEEIIAGMPDIKHYVAEVGNATDRFGGGSSTKSNRAQVSIEFVDKADRRQPSPATIDQIRDRLDRLVGAEIVVAKEEHGPPTGKPVNIEISGDDFTVLGELAARVRDRIKDVKGVVDLRDDYDRGRPEIRVTVDKEKASLLGFSTIGAASAVRAAVNGADAGTFREEDEEYDISVRLPLALRDDIGTLRDMVIPTPSRDLVPLSSIADVSFASGFGSIRRIDGQRVITVESDVAGRLPNDVLLEVQRRIAPMQFPEGYAISYTGQNEMQKESEDFLSNAFWIAVILIFMVIVPQFNSIAVPLIIMSSVLLSLVGVFLGLIITGTPFNIVMTGIGVISLAGVVVNNAIVLLDAVQKNRQRGRELFEAVVIAGKTRLRPVFLTAAAASLGMLPMATGVAFDFMTFSWEIGAESSQFWGPMAVAVIYGLIFATILTLIVLPALYLVVETWKLRIFGTPSREGAANE